MIPSGVVKAVRKRLTYANVVSTLALFLVLCGGVAIAARVGRRSVGAPQLKAGAVTTSKIKANAVTTRKLSRLGVTAAKLREGAVTTEKIFNGAVTGEKINAASTPFSRVAARLTGSSTVLLKSSFQVYPLNASTYMQAADEIDAFAGAVEVTVPSECLPPRKVTAEIIVDPAEPTHPAPAEVLAAAQLKDEGTGSFSKWLEMVPNPERSLLFEPRSAKQHEVFLVVEGNCPSMKVTSGAADVIATR